MKTKGRQKYRHILPELHLDHYSLHDLTDLAIDGLFRMKDEYLQDELHRLHWAKKNGKPTDRLQERCEDLQDTISYILACISGVQQYMPEVSKLDQAKETAQMAWGGLPAKYVVEFHYDLTAPDTTNKLIAILDRL